MREAIKLLIIEMPACSVFGLREGAMAAAMISKDQEWMLDPWTGEIGERVRDGPSK